VRINLDLSKITDYYTRAILGQVIDAFNRLPKGQGEWVKEKITATIFPYVDLKFPPVHDSIQIFNGNSPLHKGEHYIVSNKRLNFTSGVTTGDNLHITYQRIN
jgi:hypothetical protein